MGRTYDAEGVVTAIEKWEPRRYQSPMTRSGKKNVMMKGPFGIFTVKITSGDNIGHESKGLRSEELRRRGEHANIQTVFKTQEIKTKSPKRNNNGNNVNNGNGGNGGNGRSNNGRGNLSSGS